MKKLLLVSIAISFGFGAVSAEAAKGAKILPALKKLRDSGAKKNGDSVLGRGAAIRHELIIEAGKSCERERSEAKTGEDPELLVCQCVAKRVLAKLNKDKTTRLEELSDEIYKVETKIFNTDELEILLDEVNEAKIQEAKIDRLKILFDDIGEAETKEAKANRLEKTSDEIREEKINVLKILYKSYEEELLPDLDSLIQQCLAAEKPREYRDGLLIVLIIVALMIWARLARKKH